MKCRYINNGFLVKNYNVTLKEVKDCINRCMSDSDINDELGVVLPTFVTHWIRYPGTYFHGITVI